MPCPESKAGLTPAQPSCYPPLVPLTNEQRRYLNEVDQFSNFSVTDLDSLRLHMARVRKTYQVPDVTMAAILLEMAAGVQGALVRASGEEATREEIALSVKTWAVEQAILAAALTRKQRGRAEL